MKLLACFTMFFLVSVGARADASSFEPFKPRGFLLGDDMRYKTPIDVGDWAGHMFLRFAADLVSIPSDIGSWNAADYATLGATVTVTAVSWIPINGRSLDARLQDEIHRVRGVNCAYGEETSDYCPPGKSTGFHVWNDWSDILLVGLTVGLPLVVLAAGAIMKKEQLVESSTLAIEAFGLSQVTQLTLKLLTGREAPLSRQGQGSFTGPNVLEFPAGWPSGHALTLMSIGAVYATYFDIPWLQAVLIGGASVLSAFLVIDDSHYASEVIFGAVSGYLIGRWVVKHRSSLYTYGPGGLPMRLTAVTPIVMQSGGGMAAAFTF